MLGIVAVSIALSCPGESGDSGVSGADLGQVVAASIEIASAVQGVMGEEWAKLKVGRAGVPLRSGEVKPLTSGTMWAISATMLLSEEMSPALSETKSAHGATKPVIGETKPATVETKPAHNATVPVTVAT